MTEPVAEPVTKPVVQVIGIGLAGPKSLSAQTLALVNSATLLVGGKRHLVAFKHLKKTVESWPLGDFTRVFADLKSRLQAHPDTKAVILASGDPLFFGIGRLLLEAFPAEQLTFHPQVSSIQLAFSRLKLPWQDATLLSVHGRSEKLLIEAVKRGDSKIAVLTDGILTPQAIATLITALDFPVHYRLWVCENLGNDDERVSAHWPSELQGQTFASLNVVILVRQELEPQNEAITRPESNELPLIGLPDAAFKGFADRPTLITKREIRLLILGALSPLDGETFWDIGAGTGSVSIELSRLCPNAQLYAIEKTAMGAALIRQNAERLAIAPIQTIQTQAPEALADLPSADRVFIGGSSGQLTAILDFLHRLVVRPKRIVLAIATVEHLSQVITWAKQSTIANHWHYQLTQINISRSVPVGPLTRLLPLNPITLVTLSLYS